MRRRAFDAFSGRAMRGPRSPILSRRSPGPRGAPAPWPGPRAHPPDRPPPAAAHRRARVSSRRRARPHLLPCPPPPAGAGGTGGAGRRTARIGRSTVNVVPRPSSGLSTRTLPPCNSDELAHQGQSQAQSTMSALTRRYPTGGSGRTRRGEARGRYPHPCRSRQIRTCGSTRSMRKWTRPPRGVNLIALESRFHRTCCKRPASPVMGPTFGSMRV